MPPFLNIATSGRTTATAMPQDLSYQFQAQNPVSQSYLQTVDAYFNQLFVNQTSNPSLGRYCRPAARRRCRRRSSSIISRG